MFIEPTITWVPSGFSGYIWLNTKILLKIVLHVRQYMYYVVYTILKESRLIVGVGIKITLVVGIFLQVTTISGGTTAFYIRMNGTGWVNSYDYVTQSTLGNPGTIIIPSNTPSNSSSEVGKRRMYCYATGDDIRETVITISLTISKGNIKWSINGQFILYNAFLFLSCANVPHSNTQRSVAYLHLGNCGQCPGCPLDCPGCSVLRLINHSM